MLELSEEYAALKVEWYEETGTLQMSVIGKLQSDSIEHELSIRFNLAILLSELKKNLSRKTCPTSYWF